MGLLQQGVHQPASRQSHQKATPPTIRPLLSICAPAFNEEDALEDVVRAWGRQIEDAGWEAEIIVTNDGSTDRTGEILAYLAAELPRVRIVSHAKNRGYGAGMRSAMAAATGDLVLTMDSDGQSALEDWEALHRAMEQQGCDVVTGYRHAKQASLIHVAADRVLNLLVRLMFGLNLRDTNCSMKLFRGEVGRQLADLGEATGYAAPTEFLVKARLLGYRVGEARTTHLSRAGGSSKLRAVRTSLDMARFLLYLRLKQHLYRRSIISRL